MPACAGTCLSQNPISSIALLSIRETVNVRIFPFLQVFMTKTSINLSLYICSYYITISISQLIFLIQLYLLFLLSAWKSQNLYIFWHYGKLNTLTEQPTGNTLKCSLQFAKNFLMALITRQESKNQSEVETSKDEPWRVWSWACF